MPRRYILLTPADGPLWQLAEAISRHTNAPALLDFAGLARLMCQAEAGKAEVNIAQMSEILADLRHLVTANPAGVLAVLAADFPEP